MYYINFLVASKKRSIHLTTTNILLPEGTTIYNNVIIYRISLSIEYVVKLGTKAKQVFFYQK